MDSKYRHMTSLSAIFKPVVFEKKDGTLPCGLIDKYSGDLNPPISIGDTMEHSDSGIPFLYRMILHRPPLLLTGISNNMLLESGNAVAVDDMDITVVVVDDVDDVVGPSLDGGVVVDGGENPFEDDAKIRQKTVRNERFL